MAAFGLLVLIVGIAAGESGFAVAGAFVAVFAGIVFIGAWRLIRLGCWIGPEGVEIRTVLHAAQRIPWVAVERFEVQRGKSILPFIRPAPQVAIVVRGQQSVLVPGLWLRSPFTWGGAGPARIVEELNKRRPEALAAK